ncbi:MAG: hypothetical protein IKR86_06635 [Candidatus Methanomethylophilaceae archaeon]|nr:hypothetical protein [Candidatus Methanomethylophilaceae archaeon]
MADGKDRPVLISIIAILYFVFGVLMVLGGILIAISGVAVPGLEVPVAFIGGGIIVAGVISLIIAGGFWNGWKAIWYLAVIIGIIEIIFDVIALVGGGVIYIVALLIQLVLLYYIFRPKVKEFFGV